MASNPALSIYAICATIIALQLIALAFLTGSVRVLNKRYVNPEDAAMTKTERASEEHEKVARVRRAHQNALESAVPFFAIGYLYAAQGPSKDGALIYFGTFTAARLLHSVFYLWGKQPFRTLMFGIGALALIGMGVHVIGKAI
jgi:uncharacterized MAPEG superfamily protein